VTPAVFTAELSGHRYVVFNRFWLALVDGFALLSYFTLFAQLFLFVALLSASTIEGAALKLPQACWREA